jgi:hypothetical protein
MTTTINIMKVVYIKTKKIYYRCLKNRKILKNNDK